jgi:hypothetical protein
VKHFIGGYEVSLDTKIAYDKQQEANRQAEYKDRQRREELELLRQIAKNTSHWLRNRG